MFAILLGLFVACQRTPGQGLVFTTNILAAPGHPFSVTAADVNNDGKVDLISANTGNVSGPGNTLTVWTNDGSGIFGSNNTYRVGNAPNFVAVADLSSNGYPDLISANANDNTLTVLTNDGSGLFGSNATYAVGYGAACVAVADVNGDGRPDLVSANSGTNTLTVLTNDGSGRFALSATLTIGNQPLSVVAVDINGDGSVDLVSANSQDGTLSVLTNNGSGSFSSNATYSVGHRPRSVIAADVNGDGRPDLVCANLSDGTVTVLTNDGQGGFVLDATLTVAGDPISVVAADMNGDGNLDLVCANSEAFAGGNLMVLTNDGSGNFGSNTTLTLPQTVGPSCVVAADVNGDGREDLISANYYDSSTITVWTQILIVPAPFLTISSGVSTTILISWCSASTNFGLQTNSDLTSTNWGYPGYPVSVTNGTNQSVSTTPSAASLFFRLKQ